MDLEEFSSPSKPCFLPLEPDCDPCLQHRTSTLLLGCENNPIKLSAVVFYNRDIAYSPFRQEILANVEALCVGWHRSYLPVP